MTSSFSSGDRDDLRIGFACAWNPDRPTTWSGTPWRLRNALALQSDVLDIDVTVPSPAKALLRLSSARRHDGIWSSMWKHRRSAKALSARSVKRATSDIECDAVIEIGDLGPVDRPFFLVQDLSYATLRAHRQEHGQLPHFRGLTDRSLRRLDERQRRMYDQCAGVFAMSEWLAGTLVEAGMDERRVHVLPPAIDMPVTTPAPDRTERERCRLLFIGRDFDTKAGDVVVEAVRRLQGHSPSITLTIAGPTQWPLPTPIPPWVRFIGSVPHEQVIDLYDSHDLFVMPSRLEGFGIVFLEALARGLPCIGRDAFAMPEIIRPGDNGDLVRDDDPDELAAAIERTLRDDHVYAITRDEADDVANRSTWSATASSALDVVRQALRD